ncbi:hypothetical protein [uncultured Pontibacter sp.]|uniref:hypothetical protein n=1 Tax=uncultured Pontibacter sp. TaxID=453356 RepID=UPI00261C2033|nr:hypothetical protein [uncultured Pontibacter sp.]
MRKSLSSILAVAIVCLLSGCAANTYVSQVKQNNLPPLNLAFSVQEVQITDSRKDQSIEDIKLPLVSKPNSLIKHVPTLTATHQQIIENVIKENTTNAGIPVKAVINIPDSYKEFSATWSSEKERGFAQVQINLVNQESGELITACDSSGELFVQSIDATNERMEEIYQLTIKNVIYNCLKSMSGQSEK